VSLPQSVTAMSVYGLTLLAGLVDLSGLTADPFMAAAALAVAAVAVMSAAVLATEPCLSGGYRVPVPVEALHDHIRPRTVPRLRDPDARGRCRPRAPSALHPAA
jgi:hypothetical protein